MRFVPNLQFIRNLPSVPAPRFISDDYKLFVARITLSKLTVCYFIFSLVHCIIQVGLQGHAFASNARAATFLWELVSKGDAKVEGVLIFGDTLQVCDTVEDALSRKSCQLVWDGSATKLVDSTPTYSSIATLPSSPSLLPTTTTSSIPTVSPTSLPTSLSRSPLLVASSQTRSSTPLPTPSTMNNLAGNGKSNGSDPIVIILNHRSQGPRGIPQGETVVKVENLANANSSVVLSHQCLISLNWPGVALEDTKREDIVFITFQFWVLGMSIVAILNESIPHVIASLFTHLIATGWGAFQISHTTEFQKSFSRLVTDGVCGINLLPTYWGPRRIAETVSLTLNAFALLIAIILSWRLTKAFGWRTFKRMGASMQIRTQYQAVLILSIIIQLAFFFIVTSAGLWLDQLINGAVSGLTKHKGECEAITVLILIPSIPWLALGWISVRKEQRKLMAAFLTMSVLYSVTWFAMFFGASFRWTFLDWRFFGLMTTASVVLTLSALITGIFCRLGFGRGLPEHLNETNQLEDEDILFTPQTQDDASEISFEKVEFPPRGYPVPTFSAAFRPEDVDDLSEKPQFPNSQMGPRFFYASSVPFDQRVVLEPAPAHTRGHLPTSSPPLHRDDDEISSHFRSDSHSSTNSSASRKRWVLE